ncbi:unnamed protein product [Microthlaspi erraticum]|uniref:PGG domain-containing protein n=1 Tax=Microthlaspi erraticum TaxID=1685480 RepID=A0A6D2K4N5_9BRAS|nr:unnamed protein product [Microthlaspi erraticum]
MQLRRTWRQFLHSNRFGLSSHCIYTPLDIIISEGAVDVTEHFLFYTHFQWLIWVALVSAGTTRAPRDHLRADIPGPTTDEDLTLKMYKDRVNILLVVATLVATMAFAAGLSVPLC